MNITDHHTKHVSLYPLTAKTRENVLDVLQQLCYTYGFPQKIVCGSGKKFCDKNIDNFCKKIGINTKHQVPRTPTTQWLVERSNRTCKEDMHTLMASTATKVSN